NCGESWRQAIEIERHRTVRPGAECTLQRRFIREPNRRFLRCLGREAEKLMTAPRRWRCGPAVHQPPAEFSAFTRDFDDARREPAKRSLVDRDAQVQKIKA